MTGASIALPYRWVAVLVSLLWVRALSCRMHRSEDTEYCLYIEAMTDRHIFLSDEATCSNVLIKVIKRCAVFVLLGRLHGWLERDEKKNNVICVCIPAFDHTRAPHALFLRLCGVCDPHPSLLISPSPLSPPPPLGVFRRTGQQISQISGERAGAQFGVQISL